MEDILGFITLSALNFVPTGYAKCDGSLVQVNQNMALFALLGTQFGGDGVHNFGLPDLTKASPVPNLGYIICTSGIFPSRP